MGLGDFCGIIGNNATAKSERETTKKWLEGGAGAAERNVERDY